MVVQINEEGGIGYAAGKGDAWESQKSDRIIFRRPTSSHFTWWIGRGWGGEVIKGRGKKLRRGFMESRRVRRKKLQEGGFSIAAAVTLRKGEADAPDPGE